MGSYFLSFKCVQKTKKTVDDLEARLLVCSDKVQYMYNWHDILLLSPEVSGM